MRRRLDLSASLVGDPKILFLDEPTTGLDPRSRLQMWDVISALVADGTTVLLTTQYLEEADLLAEQIVVIDRGKVIAEGTSDDLKTAVGGDRLEIVVAHGSNLDDAATALRGFSDGAATVDTATRRVTSPVSGGSTILVDAVRALDTAGVKVDDLALRRPTLDDVFLTLTGHGAEEVAADAAPAGRGRGRKGA
jgi:ABC-2 type transport system ATP-binding protein